MKKTGLLGERRELREVMEKEEDEEYSHFKLKNQEIWAKAVELSAIGSK